MKYTVQWYTLYNEIHCTVKYTAQWNTLHNEIHCAMKYTAQWNTLYNENTAKCNTLHSEIHCTMKNNAQCNTLHNVIYCTMKFTVQWNTLHNEIHCTLSIKYIAQCKTLHFISKSKVLLRGLSSSSCWGLSSLVYSMSKLEAYQKVAKGAVVREAMFFFVF